MALTSIGNEVSAYFLVRDGHPIRFVLGEACPCSSLSLATLFPDLFTAQEAAEAHLNGTTRVMQIQLKVVKSCPRPKAP